MSIALTLAGIDRLAAAGAGMVERLDAQHKSVTRTLARAVIKGAEASVDLFNPA